MGGGAGNYVHQNGSIPFFFPNPQSQTAEIYNLGESLLAHLVSTYIFMRCFNAQGAQLKYLFIPQTEVCRENKYDFKNCLNMYLPSRLISWVNYMDLVTFHDIFP